MANLEITDPFDEPYLGGSSTAGLPGTFSPSVVGIAGVPYLLDTASGAYRRESFDVVQQRNTTDARDVLLLPQDVWRWQEQSWHLGAGQSNLDREDALPYRFEESFGVDPWTRWSLRLLNDTDQLHGTGSLEGQTWLTVTGDYLAVVNNQTVYWYDAVSAGSAAAGSTTVISSGNAVLDIADDGHWLTALTADRYVWTVEEPGGTPTKWANHQYTANVNMIAWEKDYLLVGDGNKLYNALKGNNPTLIFTHPDDDFRWHSAASGNSCIYVLGRLGDKTTIHRVNIKQDGTGLLPCIVAATLPDGEIGYSIDTYLGFVLIGTSKGVRVATPNNDSGDLTLGPIIPTAEPVRCFEGQDRFVWYGLSSMSGPYTGLDSDVFPAAAVPGLGRLDLSVTTTSALTPAYANDLAVWSEAAAVVRSVVTYQDKRVFSVDGAGVWFQADRLVPAGWLTEGRISYSVEDLKTGLYVQAKWDPLSGGITLEASYDDEPFEVLANFNQQGSIRSGNVSLYGQQFSRMNARQILRRNSSTQTAGPVMTRWELRAIPVKGRTSRWTLPIMNYEEIELDGVTYTRDPLSVLDTLMNLYENTPIFTLTESGRAYQVHAKDFVWQPEKLTINGRAWQGVYTMVVEEVQ